MATFVVAHGAWSSGWSWKKMRPLLRAAGHEVYTPSYTGLGERSHLASPEITLDTHIQDVVNVLFYEDLTNIILIGHSYGGMVATAVADRVPERIRKVIYLDAFVPRDGQSLNDLGRPPASDSWLIPPIPPPEDTSPEDLAWLAPRRGQQPRGTFEEPVRLTGAIDRLPRVYIYCLRHGEGDVFRPFATRAQSEPGWQYEDIDASHSPHITAPDELLKLLLRLAS